MNSPFKIIIKNKDNTIYKSLLPVRVVLSVFIWGIISLKIKKQYIQELSFVYSEISTTIIG